MGIKTCFTVRANKCYIEQTAVLPVSSAIIILISIAQITGSD